VVVTTYNIFPLGSTAMNFGVAPPPAANGDAASSVSAPVTGWTEKPETLLSPGFAA